MNTFAFTSVKLECRHFTCKRVFLHHGIATFVKVLADSSELCNEHSSIDVGLSISHINAAEMNKRQTTNISNMNTFNIIDLTPSNNVSVWQESRRR